MNVPRRTIDHQARRLGRALYLLAEPSVSTQPRDPPGRRNVLAHGLTRRGLCCLSSHDLFARLSDLAADLLTLVADALALVGVALPQAPDVGRDLADLLLVDTGDRELRRRLYRECHALRGVDQHWVAVTEREFQVAALGDHAV